MLHLIDVYAYRLIVEVWQLYWPLLASVGLCAVIERWLPLEAAQPRRAWLFNLAWHALLLSFLVMLSWGAWGRFIVWAGTVLPGSPPRLPPPQDWLDQALRVALALLAHDFLAYWVHRMQHAWPLLWAMHRFHHDERHVNASTCLRTHWMSAMLSQTLVLVPLMWLLGNDAMPMTAYVVLNAFAAFSHLNARVEFGPLAGWIVGPQYHHMHHARERSRHDSNYAPMFPLWDILFGTHRASVPGRFDETGLAEVGPSDSIMRVAAQPFSDWRRMWRKLPTRA